MEGREPNLTDPWMLVVLWAHALDRRHAARLSAGCGRLEKCYMSWTFGVPCEQLNWLILCLGKSRPHVTITTYWSQVSGVFVLFMFLCWCLRNSRKISHYFSHSCFGRWHRHWMLGSPTWVQEPQAMRYWGAYQGKSRTFLCSSNYRLGSDGRLLGVPWNKNGGLYSNKFGKLCFRESTV